METRRGGDSFHAPILEIREQDQARFWAYMAQPFDESGISVDDMPDDDPVFYEALEQADPIRDGWVGKDGQP